MEPIKFRDLPLIVRLAAMVTWFLAWVLFAELVIDRQGLGPYLPLYRIGDFCPWDVAVIVMLAVAWWRYHRKT